MRALRSKAQSAYDNELADDSEVRQEHGNSSLFAHQETLVLARHASRRSGWAAPVLAASQRA